MRTASVPLIILTVLIAGLFVGAEARDRDRGPQRPNDGVLGEMDGPPVHDRHGDHGPPMNEEETREAIEILRKIDPDKAEQLEQHLGENPQRVARALHESFPKLRRFLMMKRHDPQGFELWVEDLRLNREAMESAERLRRAWAQGNELEAAAEEVTLRQIVSDHFDIRQQIREHQLAKLEQRIHELNEQLDERASNRDELIDDHLDGLTGQAVGDRW